jgi:hypothetical protein
MRLSITSPYMHGPDVTKVQQLLKQKKWLQGAVDGVFGPDTGRAVKRGKYWLGYRLQNCDMVAGDYFYSLLTGTRQPTTAMKARTRERAANAAAQPIRLRMIGEARKWLGTKESPPDSNQVMFTKWYGLTGPWCAMFVTYCGVVVGSKAFIRGSRWAYVPYVVNDARAGRSGIAVTYSPQEGDLVCFDWTKDGVADHIGFFDHWTSSNTFKTIEGNTAIGNDSNGGEVMARDRTKNSTVQCFVHVGT